MTWRFLDSGPGPGARQMATDEALLDAVARDRSPPILRVFAFQPACLSLGRFQVVPRDHHPGDVDIVRRPSGGRAVLHSGDLCYSVVAHGDDQTVGGSIRESYRRIALALAFALKLLGAGDAPLAMPTSPGRRSGNRTACFSAFSPYELSVDGAKAIGSAQVRRGGALLQQGSLRLAADHPLEARLLGESQPSLRDLLSRGIPCVEAARSLRRAFGQLFGIALVDSTFSIDELAAAAALERKKYAGPAWTWLRTDADVRSR